MLYQGIETKLAVIHPVRDVGEAEPRPSELCFHFGPDGKEKCLEAWLDFGFPAMPEY